MSDERRWPWFQQVVDALSAALGISIAVLMAARNSWPLPGVLFVLACLGRVSSRALLSALLKKWGA